MTTRAPRPLFAIALTLGAALVGAAFATGASATSARPPAQPTAVAVVDVVAVLDGLSEKAVLEQRLQQSVTDRQAQLDEIITKIKAAQADLNGTLKEGTPEYREKVRQLLELNALAEARRNILQRIVAFDKGDMLRDIYSKITVAVQKIAERNGYDVVVLDDATFPLPAEAADSDMERAILTRSVLYRHDSVDITAQVVTLMNNEFSAP